MNELLPNAILLLCGLAGISLLLGVLWLLSKRVIVLHHETRQPMEFEFPVLGKFRTQSPVIVLAALGAFLLVYSAHERHHDLEEVQLEGAVDGGGKTVDFVVVAIPKYQFSIHRAKGLTPFSLSVPVLPHNTLRVRMYIDERLIHDQLAPLKAGKAQLGEVRYEPSGSQEQELGIAPRTSPR